MDDRGKARRAILTVGGVLLAGSLVNLLLAAFVTHHDLGGPTGFLVGTVLFAVVGLAATRPRRD